MSDLIPLSIVAKVFDHVGANVRTLVMPLLCKGTNQIYRDFGGDNKVTRSGGEIPTWALREFLARAADRYWTEVQHFLVDTGSLDAWKACISDYTN